MDLGIFFGEYILIISVNKPSQNCLSRNFKAQIDKNDSRFTHGKINKKGTAIIGPAFDPDISVVGFNDTFNNGKPKSGAVNITCFF